MTAVDRTVEMATSENRKSSVLNLRAITMIALLLPIFLAGCSSPSATVGDPYAKAQGSSYAKPQKEVQPAVTADSNAVIDMPRVKVVSVPAPRVEPKPQSAPAATPSVVSAAPLASATQITQIPQVKNTPAPQPPAAKTTKVPTALVLDPSRGQEWIQATMAKYGVYPTEGTKFVIGALPAGCAGSDGCTSFLSYKDPSVPIIYTITLRPGQLTEYLLIHEIAHAKGIRDECAADNFVRSILGPVPGHYC